MHKQHKNLLRAVEAAERLSTKRELDEAQQEIARLRGMIEAMGGKVETTPQTDLIKELVEVLQMVQAASNVYNRDTTDLTPMHERIKREAKASGVTPTAYVLGRVDKAIKVAEVWL